MDWNPMPTTNFYLFSYKNKIKCVTKVCSFFFLFFSICVREKQVTSLPVNGILVSAYMPIWVIAKIVPDLFLVGPPKAEDSAAEFFARGVKLEIDLDRLEKIID